MGTRSSLDVWLGVVIAAGSGMDMQGLNESHAIYFMMYLAGLPMLGPPL